MGGLVPVIVHGETSITETSALGGAQPAGGIRERILQVVQKKGGAKSSTLFILQYK